MSRLARENPDDERYQSGEGQREALSMILDIGEDGLLRPAPQAAYEPLHPHPWEADFYEHCEREW